MICDNISINESGRLTFAGYDVLELANKYSTPLYLMNEEKIRQRVRIYKKAMAECMPKGSAPEFASKAFSVKQIYRIMAEEDIEIDVVSPGEIYTALSVGFPMEKCFFHGNNKTDEDIEFAIKNGVGYFVADCEEEIFLINEIAKEYGINQKILLRVTPGIDTHTHKKIATGGVDSKFGIAISTGQAKFVTENILSLENITLSGFHCHIGSQIFESGPFIMAAELMFQFLAEIKNEFGFVSDILNLGGGFGVRYVEEDPVIDYAEKIHEIGAVLKEKSQAAGIEVPKIHLEPGRSIVADAGMTLYKVGSVKEILGYKNYISVDGGMADNPRFALYEAKYTVLNASNPTALCDYKADVVGRCCESGDIIAENVMIARPKRNDVLAVLTTGAYNYSMASNYNRIPRPPVVMLSKEGDYVAVKRETLEDICKLDV